MFRRIGSVVWWILASRREGTVVRGGERCKRVARDSRWRVEVCCWSDNQQGRGKLFVTVPSGVLYCSVAHEREGDVERWG